MPQSYTVRLCGIRQYTIRCYLDQLRRCSYVQVPVPADLPRHRTGVWQDADADGGGKICGLTVQIETSAYSRGRESNGNPISNVAIQPRFIIDKMDSNAAFISREMIKHSHLLSSRTLSFTYRAEASIKISSIYNSFPKPTQNFRPSSKRFRQSAFRSLNVPCVIARCSCSPSPVLPCSRLPLRVMDESLPLPCPTLYRTLSARLTIEKPLLEPGSGSNMQSSSGGSRADDGSYARTAPQPPLKPRKMTRT